MLSPNDPLCITQVGNGFLVRLDGGMLSSEHRVLHAHADMRVFQSFAELTRFLRAHFSHRAHCLLGDPCVSVPSPQQEDHR